METRPAWSLLLRMQRIVLKSETDWEGWRQAARALVLTGVEPDKLTWVVGKEREALPDASGSFHVPRAPRSSAP